MSTDHLRLAGAGLFLLFIFLSGFWLSRTGKPYNGIIFNIHKLIGLAAGVFLILTVHRIYQAAPFSALEISAIVVTVLLFIVNVVTGGLVSIEKPMPKILLKLHHITPYLIVLSTAATLYLLLLHKS